MNPDDYDSDGNNIVPCPICLDVYCPSKENGKCPDEEEFIKHYKNPMNEEDCLVVEAMEKYGGSFVQALARACHHADANNLYKIKVVWKEYWEQYREMAGLPPKMKTATEVMITEQRRAIPADLLKAGATIQYSFPEESTIDIVDYGYLEPKKCVHGNDSDCKEC